MPKTAVPALDDFKAALASCDDVDPLWDVGPAEKSDFDDLKQALVDAVSALDGTDLAPGTIDLPDRDVLVAHRERVRAEREAIERSVANGSFDWKAEPDAFAGHAPKQIAAIDGEIERARAASRRADAACHEISEAIASDPAMSDLRDRHFGEGPRYEGRGFVRIADFVANVRTGYLDRIGRLSVLTDEARTFDILLSDLRSERRYAEKAHGSAVARRAMEARTGILDAIDRRLAVLTTDPEAAGRERTKFLAGIVGDVENTRRFVRIDNGLESDPSEENGETLRM